MIRINTLKEVGAYLIDENQEVSFSLFDSTSDIYPTVSSSNEV